MSVCLCRLDAKNCKRINLGGCQAAVYLQRLLQLKYPGHFAAITLSRMEEILHEHSYIAQDYIEGKTALIHHQVVLTHTKFGLSTPCFEVGLNSSRDILLLFCFLCGLIFKIKIGIKFNYYHKKICIGSDFSVNKNCDGFSRKEFKMSIFFPLYINKTSKLVRISVFCICFKVSKVEQVISLDFVRIK